MAEESDIKRLVIRVEGDGEGPRAQAVDGSDDPYRRAASSDMHARLDALAASAAKEAGRQVSLIHAPEVKRLFDARSSADAAKDYVDVDFEYKNGGFSGGGGAGGGTFNPLGAAGAAGRAGAGGAAAAGGAGGAGGGGGGAAGGAAAAAGGAGAGGAALAGALATGGAALVFVSLLHVAEQIYGAVQDIDEHFLSLADDIRMFSGNVAMADAESKIINMQAMLRRAAAIGPDVAEYQRQRALLDADFADIVTEMEQVVLPLAVDVLRTVRLSLPALKGASWLVNKEGVRGLISGAILEAIFAYGRSVDRKKTLLILDMVDDLFAGKGDPAIPTPKPSKPGAFH